MSSRQHVDNERVTSEKQFSNKVVKLIGMFSLPAEKAYATYQTELTLHFDNNCQLISVKNNCQYHEKYTLMVMCPCACVVKLFEHAKKENPNLPVKEKSELFPDCLQIKKSIGYIIDKSRKGYDISIPKLDRQSKSLSNLNITNNDRTEIKSSEVLKLLRPAPKYKDVLNGPRVRSNGETKSSARSRRIPKHNREGSTTKRHTTDSQLVGQTKPSRRWVEAGESQDVSSQNLLDQQQTRSCSVCGNCQCRSTQ